MCFTILWWYKERKTPLRENALHNYIENETVCDYFALLLAIAKNRVFFAQRQSCKIRFWHVTFVLLLLLPRLRLKCVSFCAKSVVLWRKFNLLNCKTLWTASPRALALAHPRINKRSTKSLNVWTCFIHKFTTTASDVARFLQHYKQPTIEILLLLLLLILFIYFFLLYKQHTPVSWFQANAIYTIYE